MKQWLRAAQRQIGSYGFGPFDQHCSGLVLLFHEIEDQDGYCREFKRGCSESFLDSLILELHHEKWEFVSLEEAMRIVAARDASRRFVVMTFDDGYRNTLTRARPILERNSVPFMVYIPTGAPTRELNAWWLGVRALFRQYDSVAISGMERKFECSDIASKISAHNTVNAWVHEDYRRVVDLRDTFRSYGISLQDLNEAYFMDGSELRALARSPWVTIGAHSTTHAALSQLDVGEARREMSDNRSYLEESLQRPVFHFSYPYGTPQACGPRESLLAAEVGFRTAVTTREQPVYPFHAEHLHQIPRIGVAGEASALGWFMKRIHGIEETRMNSDSLCTNFLLI